MLHGGVIARDDRAVRSSVTLTPHARARTVFAFRIIVDIALKALSPAGNDLTSAVLALDQVHRLCEWLCEAAR